MSLSAVPSTLPLTKGCGIRHFYKLTTALILATSAGFSQQMTSATVIGGRVVDIFPAAGYTNNLALGAAAYGSATCPTNAKWLVFSQTSAGNFLTRANGVGPAVTNTTVTNGSGWERNRGGFDINTTISGSTSVVGYIGVLNEAASTNSIPYSCYKSRTQ